MGKIFRVLRIMRFHRFMQISTIVLFFYTTACEGSNPVEQQSILDKANTPILNIDAPSQIQAEPKPESSPDPEKEIPPKFQLDAPEISQFPEFYNGCEVTSLAMVTAYLGLPYSKNDLEELLLKDTTKLVMDQNQTILSWGDPETGFVGDIRGNELGYSVYNKPLAKLLNQVYPPGSLNLTGKDFQEIENVIAHGKPVVVWTTEDFQPTDEWVTWKTPSGETFKGTFRVHAVVVTGYDEKHIYVNNPLTGEKDEQVEKAAFLESWEQLGRQAITYK